MPHSVLQAIQEYSRCNPSKQEDNWHWEAYAQWKLAPSTTRNVDISCHENLLREDQLRRTLSIPCFQK
jgi:hypothetical protein